MYLYFLWSLYYFLVANDDILGFTSNDKNKTKVALIIWFKRDDYIITLSEKPEKFKFAKILQYLYCLC